MKRYQHRRIIIWSSALALYVACVVGVFLDNQILVWLLVIGVFIPVVILYVLLVRREHKYEKRWLMMPIGASPSERGGLIADSASVLSGVEPRKPPPKRIIKDTVEALAAVFLAVILAIATLVWVHWHPEDANEFRALWTRCDRDASQVTTLPVDQSVTASGATVVVHRVTYNVPQTSRRPTSDSRGYRCEKATLIELSVHDPSPDRFNLSRFVFQTDDDPATLSPRYKTDEYDHYIETEDLPLLQYTLSGGTNQERRWLVFAVAEDNSNVGSVLVFNEYEEDLEKASIALPDPPE
ncbi:hypothetical protein IEU95_12430 [Hoyosella rhizosphaerae]|uniref:Uncharacterized protein n=1 Tax=Hoyosella rhizosphaerae TaxID=1755582 RepID=A0A916U8A9_9ACTN|nr:hypothetical protein [Hoyosella rhizosphaerae]MBN4927642.1 hypothetical protein [Hoyosella rhizosphaerae]GGC62844.1 hypothetical protein GCM10011410_14090 [Hoyosella rhizosphaerae]